MENSLDVHFGKLIHCIEIVDELIGSPIEPFITNIEASTRDRVSMSAYVQTVEDFCDALHCLEFTKFSLRDKNGFTKYNPLAQPSEMMSLVFTRKMDNITVEFYLLCWNEILCQYEIMKHVEDILK